MFCITFLLLISTKSVLLIQEDIQLEKKSKLTEEVLLDVYNTNISLTELQDIQNLARRELEKNLTSSSGRGARTLDFLGDVWIGLQCLTFHCLADITKAGNCCIKSQNVHCCVIYRNHYESVVHSTQSSIQPCYSSYNNFQDYFNNYGDNGCNNNNGYTTSRPPYRPSYHDNSNTVTYYPILTPVTRPPSSSSTGYNFVDWNTKTKSGECPNEISFEHTERRGRRQVKRVKVKRLVNRDGRSYNTKWNLDINSGPARDYRNTPPKYMECSNDFDCLGRRKCCYTRLSYKDFQKICRYPLINGVEVGRI